MRHRTLAVLALAASLAGCPLPQPLPEYKQGATVTPPRILSDGIRIGTVPSNSQAVILVPANCATEPTYPLSAQVHDANTIEQIEARWFVNYAPSPDYYALFWKRDTIPPNPDALDLVRSVPQNDANGVPQPAQFRPYQFHEPVTASCALPCKDPGVVRVVELVVSNGFDPAGSTTLPNRMPLPGFETQVYRWVFLTVTPTATVACPP